METFTTTIRVDGNFHHDNQGSWKLSPLQSGFMETFTTTITVDENFHHDNHG